MFPSLQVSQFFVVLVVVCAVAPVAPGIAIPTGIRALADDSIDSQAMQVALALERVHSTSANAVELRQWDESIARIAKKDMLHINHL